jgi:hypothetical protein
MADEYPYQVPRILHKPYGDSVRVDSIADCEAALADGWELRPPTWPPETRPVVPEPKKKKREAGK